MFRVCAWCDRLLGITPPLADADLTHGICGECAERLHREELQHRGQTLIVVRHSRRDLVDRLEGQYAGVEGVSIRMDTRVGERRRPSVYPGLERRRLDRRQRALFPSQLAAWRTLGVFVVHGGS